MPIGALCDTFAVVICPLPTWMDVVLNSSDTSYGSKLVYGCSAGQSFPDGKLTKQATCQRNGTWQPSLTKCTGNNRLFLSSLSLTNHV